MARAPLELQSGPVRYEVEDLIVLSKLVGRSPLQILRLVAGAIVILLLFAILAEVWALTGLIDWASLIVMSTVAIAVLIFSIRRVRAHMWLKIAARSPLFGPHSYAISQTALRISSPRSSSEVRWAAFTDVKRVGDRLFLFMSRRQAFIIPCRAFRERAHFDEFAAAALKRWESSFRT